MTVEARLRDLCGGMRPALLAIVTALALPPAAAAAQPAASTSAGLARAAARTFDYSRFSDGPRNVPRRRGASLERSNALGLGTRDAARQLLSGPPRAEWVRAAAGAPQDELLWPVEGGRFGRGFGYVRRTRPDLRHDGVDIGADEGAPVRAIADGIVAYSDNGLRGYGNCVLVVHPNGMVSLYAHNSRNTVQPGWRVRRGERLALLGRTGIAHGPHLHFELRVGGRVVDPMPYFTDRSAPPSERDVPLDAAPSTVARAEAERAEAAPRDPAPPAELGSVALARELRRAAPPQGLVDQAGGRLFRNLLWPTRGGRVAGRVSARRPALRVAAPGAAVRAAADGLVAYAGRVRGLGQAIVLVHRNGWVTVYGQAEALHVEAGQHVERGEWIARAGPRLHFELRDGGVAADPTPLLVQVPDDAALGRPAR